MAGQHKMHPAGAAAVYSSSHRMTFGEFLGSDFTNAEWVDGKVVELTNPSYRHQAVSDFLVALLNLFAKERRVGEAVSAPFKMKPGESFPGRQPDVLFFFNERRKSLRTQYFAAAADIVIEVISPYSRQRDQEEKFEEYQRAGVGEYWLIDPIRHQASFYRLAENGLFETIKVAGDGIFRSQVLEGFWIRVDWLWMEPLPSLWAVLQKWEWI